MPKAFIASNDFGCLEVPVCILFSSLLFPPLFSSLPTCLLQVIRDKLDKPLNSVKKLDAIKDSLLYDILIVFLILFFSQEYL